MEKILLQWSIPGSKPTKGPSSLAETKGTYKQNLNQTGIASSTLPNLSMQSIRPVAETAFRLPRHEKRGLFRMRKGKKRCLIRRGLGK
ncbi:MAG: hypothetical protein DWI28_06000 [Planctomycetota bacterium]|nr:MAG: hypothetical protein DWI28_06000 [Planctomycetota bacterium]